MTARTNHPLGPALAAALALAGALAPALAEAASCCGGGGSGAAVLPKNAAALLDLSGDWERYDGAWDTTGDWVPDPPGVDLAQYRLSLSGGYRLAADWQVGLSVPYVWNSNGYPGRDVQSSGVGDSALSLWWEAYDERSAWRLLTAADWLPSVKLGVALTVPTGISPYDDVADSLLITGRGYYRADVSLMLDKSYRAWSASLSATYGVHLSRPVNRLYGRYVEPYSKKAGDRGTLGGSVGYRHFIGTGGTSLAFTAALAWLFEQDGTSGGAVDATSGLQKTSVTGTVTWAGTDEDWSGRLSWNHSIQRDGWGEGFPTTDIFTLGVRRAFR